MHTGILGEEPDRHGCNRWCTTAYHPNKARSLRPMELSHSKGSRPQGSDEYISLKPLKGQQEPANVDGNSLFASSLDPSPIQISSGPNKDWNSIVLLVILCNILQTFALLATADCLEDMLQGVPLGLALGSLPYLLKANSNLSYAAMGVFSFAQYPYSLKLLWSPIVDSIYFLGFGRRKTWIVPIQIVVGLIFLLGGKRIERSLDNVSPTLHIHGWRSMLTTRSSLLQTSMASPAHFSSLCSSVPPKVSSDHNQVSALGAS